MTVRTGDAEITSERVSDFGHKHLQLALGTPEVEGTEDVGRMLEAVRLAIVCSALK